MKINTYFLHALMLIIGVLMMVCSFVFCYANMGLYSGKPYKQLDLIINGLIVLAIGVFLFYNGLKYIRKNI